MPSEVVAGGSGLFLGWFNRVRVAQQVKLLEGLSCAVQSWASMPVKSQSLLLAAVLF